MMAHTFDPRAPEAEVEGVLIYIGTSGQPAPHREITLPPPRPRQKKKKAEKKASKQNVLIFYLFLFWGTGFAM